MRVVFYRNSHFLKGAPSPNERSIILQIIEIETFMMLHKYNQNRIFNLAVLVLPKLYFGFRTYLFG